MKKRVYFYLNESDRRLLENKIHEQGITGKGKIERFMENIIRNPVIILKGDSCKVEIKPC